jgi:hypothetical protein
LLSLYRMKTPKSIKGEIKMKKYICKNCDFSSSNKKDYKRHTNTIKHKKKDIEKKGFYIIQKGENVRIVNGIRCLVRSNTYFCENCGKTYKYKSGLCKHEKKCNIINIVVDDENTILKNEIMELKTKMFKQMNDTTTNLNTTMKTLIASQKEDNRKNMEQLESFKNIIPKIGDTYNNKVSINVYLNEKCKDAMNLTDFVENLEISLEDLVYTKNHGFVKGISNIFVKQLQDMEPTQRPIHCSDAKRLQFYVKDEDKWEKDKTHQKINNSIDNIATMQIKRIKEWEKKNPNYLNKESLLMEWHAMVHAIMGGGNEIIRTKNCDSIKKELSTTVEMKGGLIHK